jgi:hypothetical protein
LSEESKHSENLDDEELDFFSKVSEKFKQDRAKEEEKKNNQ